MRFNEFHDEQTDEMIGVKKYQDLTAAQAMQKASEELGLPLYGRGAFGRVIQSPDPDWVYKFYERDSAYDAYVDFLQQHPNKHFPVIKKVKKITNFFRRYGIHPDKFTVVTIEKLNKIPPMKLMLVLRVLDMHQFDRDRIGLDVPPMEQKKLYELWMAAQQIRKSSVMRPGRFMDFHGGNVMQRDDGTVVIIDPVASHGELDIARDVATMRARKDPMIKGPHYRSEPAQSTPFDDPDNPMPPDMDATPSAPKSKQPTDPYEIPLSQQARMDWGQTNKSQWGDEEDGTETKSMRRRIASILKKMKQDEQR